eukprot:CAMPEP_0179414576 /NCGR_PEP_ID=MMETSP0799-20121207/5747_1 /TAXON_ID=46947 /ORGANISM="Geminigera cryophila, Strain CCMP2564" /LENGTH=105 /DNA_ID=CAMNT_0021187207 /DNA_START=176 /DNA_END=493 /DNA_ORIENTATION=+
MAAQMDSICRPSLVSFANNQDSVSANVSSLFEHSVGRRWTRGRFKRTRDVEAEHYLKQRGKSQLPSGWKKRKEKTKYSPLCKRGPDQEGKEDAAMACTASCVIGT